MILLCFLWKYPSSFKYLILRPELQSSLELSFYSYRITGVKQPFKNRQNKILIANNSLMKVKSIAECHLGALCNTFDLH